MHKLAFLLTIFLLTAPNVYAEACKNTGAVWAAHMDGSTDEYFALGESVYIKGDNLPEAVRNQWASWNITDQDADGPEKPAVAWGEVFIDENGDFFEDSGWDIPPDDYVDHNYRLNVFSGECSSGFKTKKDSFETIPEFPTAALPAIITLGGYLAIRIRRRG
jgi:hypothetical protein